MLVNHELVEKPACRAAIARPGAFGKCLHHWCQPVIGLLMPRLGCQKPRKIGGRSQLPGQGSGVACNGNRPCQQSLGFGGSSEVKPN